jgi:choline dehydrogenase-like flavoprotein
MGTCAMGPNDDDVLDPRLRVRGVTNLRVVDASVFPTMVAGNLTGPVSALAWRAVDFIVENA